MMPAGSRPAAWLDAVARRLGGARVLALPVLRVLAVLLGLAWIALGTRSAPAWGTAAVLAVGFTLYSAVVLVALWLRPAATLRLNVLVLAVDLAFGLALIRFTGGAASALFLALLVIAGLQSYYYGIRRGVLVAAVATAGYLAVVWPMLHGGEWANVVVRLTTLLGTAIGIGVLADAEDRERAKVAALTSQAHTRERFIGNVVERLREGIVALSADGRVLTWNEAMESRLGQPAESVVGRDFFGVFPHAADQPWGAAVRQLLRGELEAFTSDAVEDPASWGPSAVMSVKGSLLREGGRLDGVVLLLEDITERVALERTAREAEKLAALGTLAAGVAHELNNPIGVISSRVELMLLDADARALPAEVRDDLGVLHRHAQRVARIALGLLSFARQTPRTMGVVDLNKVVEDTLILVEPTMRDASIHLRSELTPTLPPVWGDAHALQQVVVNLLTNARDALPAGGHVRVATERQGDGAVRLTVHDTGPGIAPDALGRIFDPFFTTKPQGTGLGLSITYGIVRDHAGTIDVESQPGRGTTFAITLPRSGGAAA